MTDVAVSAVRFCCRKSIYSPSMSLTLLIKRLVYHKVILECLSTVRVKSVPQLGMISLDYTVDEQVDFSIDTIALNLKVQREGIVLRTQAKEFDLDLGTRRSLKAIKSEVSEEIRRVTCVRQATHIFMNLYGWWPTRLRRCDDWRSRRATGKINGPIPQSVQARY